MDDKDDGLTPKQKERLRNLQTSVQLSQVTVSFSLEQRQDSGRKMSAFYSVNATRANGARWTLEEARLIECILSKHVVGVVYRDAVNRGVIPREIARIEMPGILASYDANTKRILGEGKDES